MPVDEFQERYLKHQENKNIQLSQYLEYRKSNRVFSPKEIEQEDIDEILKSIDLSPSSCNRKAINIEVISDKWQKELLSGLLVGGVGWIHRANKILLLFANRKAYKENLDYMPYLDSGFLSMTILLTCEKIGLSACYVNPNVRQFNEYTFHDKFNKKSNIFVGSIAIGHKNEK